MLSSMLVCRGSALVFIISPIPSLPPSLLPKQFCGVLILYAYLLELSPMQYLYADLFVVLPFVTFMPSMEATPKLTRGTPETNLVSFPVMRSIFGHSALIIFFQLFQQWLLLQQDWYHGPDYDAPGFDRQVRLKKRKRGREGGTSVQYVLASLFLSHPLTHHSSLPSLPPSHRSPSQAPANSSSPISCTSSWPSPCVRPTGSSGCQSTKTLSSLPW